MEADPQVAPAAGLENPIAGWAVDADGYAASDDDLTWQALAVRPVWQPRQLAQLPLRLQHEQPQRQPAPKAHANHLMSESA